MKLPKYRSDFRWFQTSWQCHRRLYCFGKPSDTPALEPMIAGKINVDLIRAHWQDILRVAASIRTGTVTASLIMRQLASFPRQNGVAAALRELGRLERTLFTLNWISNPDMRREGGQELNKGEAKNSLSRAVFIHRLGEIRDRTYENQQHRASGLNLLVTAIILWNTRWHCQLVWNHRKSERYFGSFIVFPVRICGFRPSDDVNFLQIFQNLITISI